MPAATRRNATAPEDGPTSAELEQQIRESAERTALLQRLAEQRQAERQAQAEYEQLLNPTNAATAGTSRGPAWRPRAPTVYNGNDMSLLETFLFQCRTAFALDGAPTASPQRVTWASQYIATELGTLWETRTKDYEDDQQWGAFMDYLKDRIALPQMREDEVRQKLERARQKADQTPQAFDQYLSSIESQLTGSPESDEAKGRRFLYKLQPELLNAIRANNPDNLDLRRSAIVTTAARAWVAFEPSRMNRKRNVSEATQLQTHQSRKKQIRDDSQKPEDRRQSASSEKTKAESSTPKPDYTNKARCPHCKKLGHEGPNCWFKFPELRPTPPVRPNAPGKPGMGKGQALP